MNKYLINNNCDKLILFFAGWGCDEYEFEHLKSKYDVLILYNYLDLNLNFDFSKYKEINIISFSAGVFASSIFKYDFKINKAIATSGNPYLFDEKLGLSKDTINVLRSVNEDNCYDFIKNYIVKTDEEYKNFNNSKRTIKSCNDELDSLIKLYNLKKQDIKDIFNTAVIGAEDSIFNVENQKNYYKNRLKIVKNARHNLFFRIKNFEDIFLL